MRRYLLLVFLVIGHLGGLLGGGLFAQKPPPPVPVRWVTDSANLLSPSARTTLDLRLKAYQIGGDTSARSAQERGPREGTPIGTGGWIIIGLLALAFLALAVTHPGLAVWLLFNLLSGGRGGGGGGDGGFSGGGGRSGGGGASGSW